MLWDFQAIRDASSSWSCIKLEGKDPSQELAVVIKSSLEDWKTYKNILGIQIFKLDLAQSLDKYLGFKLDLKTLRTKFISS